MIPTLPSLAGPIIYDGRTPLPYLGTGNISGLKWQILHHITHRVTQCITIRQYDLKLDIIKGFL